MVKKERSLEEAIKARAYATAIRCFLFYVSERARIGKLTFLAVNAFNYIIYYLF